MTSNCPDSSAFTIMYCHLLSLALTSFFSTDPFLCFHATTYVYTAQYWTPTCIHLTICLKCVVLPGGDLESFSEYLARYSLENMSLPIIWFGWRLNLLDFCKAMRFWNVSVLFCISKSTRDVGNHASRSSFLSIHSDFDSVLQKSFGVFGNAGRHEMPLVMSCK